MEGTRDGLGLEAKAACVLVAGFKTANTVDQRRSELCAVIHCSNITLSSHTPIEPTGHDNSDGQLSLSQTGH